MSPTNPSSSPRPDAIDSERFWAESRAVWALLRLNLWEPKMGWQTATFETKKSSPVLPGITPEPPKEGNPTPRKYGSQNDQPKAPSLSLLQGESIRLDHAIQRTLYGNGLMETRRRWLATPAYRAYRMAGAEPDFWNPQPLVMLCPMGLLAPFLAGVDELLILQRVRVDLKEERRFLSFRPGPWLMVQRPILEILDFLPMDSMPIFPLTSTSTKVPFAAEAITRLNEAFQVAEKLMPDGPLWAPVLPRPSFHADLTL